MISVVVPIYNQERYLRKSIPSILRQEYRDMELVLVNDGSTDKSLKIIRKFQNRDSRIRIIDKENGGLIDAVAAGVEAACGEYIAFVDPDDYVGKHFLQDLVELIEDCDIAAAGMYTTEISRNEKSRKVYLSADHRYLHDDLERLKRDFFWDKDRAVGNPLLSQSRCNKLYKKSIIDKMINEYREHREAVIGEDTIFNYLVLRHAKGVVTKREPVEYYYCLRSDASMTRKNDYLIRYEKNKKTFYAFREVLKRYHSRRDMAYELLYLQMQVLVFQSAKDPKEYQRLQKAIRKDQDYLQMYDILISNAKGIAKVNMIRKKINELLVPVGIALKIRQFRSGLGKIRLMITK